MTRWCWWRRWRWWQNGYLQQTTTEVSTWETNDENVWNENIYCWTQEKRSWWKQGKRSVRIFITKFDIRYKDSSNMWRTKNDVLLFNWGAALLFVNLKTKIEHTVESVRHRVCQWTTLHYTFFPRRSSFILNKRSDLLQTDEQRTNIISISPCARVERKMSDISGKRQLIEALTLLFMYTHVRECESDNLIIIIIFRPSSGTS